MSDLKWKEIITDRCVYEFGLATLMKLARPPVKLGLEIGTGWGNSGDLFLETFPEASLISLDIDQTHEAIHQLKEKHSGRFFNYTPEQFMGSDGLQYQFDYLYIDGDHSYGGVLRDIILWEPCLKPGGLLIFDDVMNREYSGMEGVKKAIESGLNKHNYWPEIYVRTMSGPVAFIKKELTCKQPT